MYVRLTAQLHFSALKSKHDSGTENPWSARPKPHPLPPVPSHAMRILDATPGQTLNPGNRGMHRTHGMHDDISVVTPILRS